MKQIIAVLLTGFYLTSLDAQAAAVAEGYDEPAVHYRAPFHLDPMAGGAGGGDGGDGPPSPRNQRILPEIDLHDIHPIGLLRDLRFNAFFESPENRAQRLEREAGLRDFFRGPAFNIPAFNINVVLGNIAGAPIVLPAIADALIRPFNFAPLVLPPMAPIIFLPPQLNFVLIHHPLPEAAPSGSNPDIARGG